MSELAREVKVKFAFLKVGRINTKSHQFDADVFVQAKWVEPRLLGTTELSSSDLQALWDPKLQINNLEKRHKDVNETDWGFKMENGKPTVFHSIRVKGSFYENMELEHFPRDVQDLSIIVTSDRKLRQINLVADINDLSTVETSTFQDKQEWRIYNHVEVSNTPPGNEENKFASEFTLFQNKPIIAATARVARRSGYFFWNSIFIMMFIVNLSFCGFAMNTDDVKHRIAMNLTLLLTSVTFKLSVKQHLPLIPYLTGIDIYLMCCMMFLCFMTVLYSLLPVLQYYKPDMADKADLLCLIVVAPYQIMFHVVFFTVFYVKTNTRRKVMKKKEELYKVELECQRMLRKSTFIADVRQSIL